MADELQEAIDATKRVRSATCKNCRFWGQFSDGVRGNCDSNKWTATAWNKEDSVSDGVEYPDEDDRGVTTGPDFGCIHFEERKQEGGG